jgi:hypothetical protein
VVTVLWILAAFATVVAIGVTLAALHDAIVGGPK